MIDGDKHRDLALAREGRGQVGAPHRVHCRGNDGAVVVARPPGRPDPGGRQQVGRADACYAQPRPDLPVPLAVKGAGGQDRADRVHQRRIRHWPNRARTPGRFGPRGGEMPIDAGPRGAPNSAHAGQTIGLAACGRDGPAHGRDLRRAKGRLASRAAILASSSSRSSSISPSLALSRSVSSASPSVGRVARLASPAATKVSRHPVRVAAVTPSARERISRSSPRNRRSTASRLRWRDMRPPRPKPTPPEAAVSVVIVTLPRITSALKGVSANREAQQGLNRAQMSPKAAQSASNVRVAALRRSALILANAISIGFRSGEYCGRNRNQAPRALSAVAARALLWTERLSAITTSPGRRVGASWVST